MGVWDSQSWVTAGDGEYFSTDNSNNSSDGNNEDSDNNDDDDEQPLPAECLTLCQSLSSTFQRLSHFT